MSLESANPRTSLQSRVSSTRNLNSKAGRRASSSRVKHITRWVVKERLPFFVHSKLYRVYKFFNELTTKSSPTLENDSLPGDKTIEDIENHETTTSSTNQQRVTKSSVHAKLNDSEFSQSTNLPSIKPATTSTSNRAANHTGSGDGNRTNIKRSQSFPIIVDTTKQFPAKTALTSKTSFNCDDIIGGTCDNGEGREVENESNSSRPQSVLEFHHTDERTNSTSVSPEIMNGERRSFAKVCMILCIIIFSRVITNFYIF